MAQPMSVLFDPVDRISPAVEARAWPWPVGLLLVAMVLSSVAFALRWDARPSTLAQLQQAGELAQMSEVDLASKVTTAMRVRLVFGVGSALVLVPLKLLLLAVMLKVVAWLLGRRATFKRLFSAAALAALPLALFHFIFALCALRQPVLTEAAWRTLVPSSLAASSPTGPRALLALREAVDFFQLWSVGLLGLGFAAATGLRRGAGLVVAVVLYAMYVGVFMIGLPGLAGGGK